MVNSEDHGAAVPLWASASALHCLHTMAFELESVWAWKQRVGASSVQSGLQWGVGHARLMLLVSGVPMVDADDWRKHCQGSVVEYLPGLKSPPPPLPAAASDEQKRDYKIRVKLYECRGLAKWFWEVVEEMGMTERAKVRVGVDCERRE